jgi:hypothetical protein
MGSERYEMTDIWDLMATMSRWTHTLIGQIVDEFGVLAILAGQRLLELTDRCVDLEGAVSFEAVVDNAKHPLPDRQLVGLVVAHPFGRLQRIGGGGLRSLHGLLLHVCRHPCDPFE